jgi:Glycosyl hydrolase family 81 C-terminal domain
MCASLCKYQQLLAVYAIIEVARPKLCLSNLENRSIVYIGMGTLQHISVPATSCVLLLRVTLSSLMRYIVHMHDATQLTAFIAATAIATTTQPLQDFFDGHSWASGLFSQANGKSQESSSEAVNAYYAVYLMGLATGNAETRDWGRILLASEVSHSSQLLVEVVKLVFYAISIVQRL